MTTSTVIDTYVEGEVPCYSSEIEELDELMNFYKFSYQPSSKYKGTGVFELILNNQPQSEEEEEEGPPKKLFCVIHCDPETGVEVCNELPADASDVSFHMVMPFSTFHDVFWGIEPVQTFIFSSACNVKNWAYKSVFIFANAFDYSTANWKKYYAHKKDQTEQEIQIQIATQTQTQTQTQAQTRASDSQPLSMNQSIIFRTDEIISGPLHDNQIMEARVSLDLGATQPQPQPQPQPRRKRKQLLFPSSGSLSRLMLFGLRNRLQIKTFDGLIAYSNTHYGKKQPLSSSSALAAIINKNNSNTLFQFTPPPETKQAQSLPQLSWPRFNTTHTQSLPRNHNNYYNDICKNISFVHRRVANGDGRHSKHRAHGIRIDDDDDSNHGILHGSHPYFDSEYYSYNYDYSQSIARKLVSFSQEMKMMTEVKFNAFIRDNRMDKETSNWNLLMHLW